MGIINVLDFRIANLIAAGEVVERPASAVKELLENSIDAGADEVTVEIKKGGISFIRVTDNGCGMSEEDMPTAIKRHATSKIKSASDLDRIMTLGFRGEALAAIASVSDMRIISKQKSDTVGRVLEAECGRITDFSETGCKDGTTVIIENLFANVPARRKFLKKDSSEGMAVISTVQKIALSHPDVAVRMINNGNIEFTTQGDSKVLSAVYAVMGTEFASGLYEVNSMSDGIEIYGYITKPDRVRANRNYQNFFINGRYIRSKTATAALEQAFDSYLEAGRFPGCVLYINIHPSFVDVNVHPTKLEVKFSNEKLVFEAVYCAVKNALLSDPLTVDGDETDETRTLFEKEKMKESDHSLYNAFVPVYDRITDDKSEDSRDSQLKLFDKNEAADRASSYKQANNNPVDVTGTQSKAPETASPSAFIKNIIPFDLLEDSIPEELKVRTEDNAGGGGINEGSAESEKQKNDLSGKEQSLADMFSLSVGVSTGNCPPYRILGEAFRTYVYVETEGKLLIIDKHAAHERILFEQMKKIMKAQRGAGQLLIIPLRLELTPEEADALATCRKETEELGYKTEADGNTVIITQIPSSFNPETAENLLVSIAGGLANGEGSIEASREHYFERALYQASCKAATKGGFIDSDETIRWIVEAVLTNKNIRYCPHGRPVAVEESKSEIEKIFKRI